MNYSKLSARFWTGETGRAIRGDIEAQLVAVYLVTSPHSNMLGYYYLPITYISTDTGLTIEGASKALQRLCDEGFCVYDKGSEVVWVHEMAKLQVGESLEPKDKRVISIAREYESLPNNLFLEAFFDKYGEAYKMPLQRTFKAPSKPTTATASVTASTAVAATPAENRSQRASRDAGQKREGPTTATWLAYANAYQQRYGVDPTRNATVNAQIASFVRRVPAEEAPDIAAFYVRHNKAFYVGKKHSTGLMMQDAEGLRTEWLCGRQVTDTEARQADRTAATANAFAPLIAEAEERERLANAAK